MPAMSVMWWYVPAVLALAGLVISIRGATKYRSIGLACLAVIFVAHLVQAARQWWYVASFEQEPLGHGTLSAPVIHIQMETPFVLATLLIAAYFVARDLRRSARIRRDVERRDGGENPPAEPGATGR